MFVKIREEYFNLDQIARVEFKDEGGKFVATIIFAKPGGSDRHFLYNEDAKTLREHLDAPGKKRKVS